MNRNLLTLFTKDLKSTKYLYVSSHPRRSFQSDLSLNNIVFYFLIPADDILILYNKITIGFYSQLIHHTKTISSLEYIQ